LIGSGWAICLPLLISSIHFLFMWIARGFLQSSPSMYSIGGGISRLSGYGNLTPSKHQSLYVSLARLENISDVVLGNSRENLLTRIIFPSTWIGFLGFLYCSGRSNMWNNRNNRFISKAVGGRGSCLIILSQGILNLGYIHFKLTSGLPVNGATH